MTEIIAFIGGVLCGAFATGPGPEGGRAMRELSQAERKIAAGMAIAGDTPSTIAYAFGISQSDARALMGNNAYTTIPRVVWDLDQPDEHPTLDAMFYIDHDVVHLLQGNDHVLDQVIWPLRRLDALIAAIREEPQR